MSDAQTSDQKIYVRIAGLLMVACLLYGALSLAGIIR